MSEGKILDFNMNMDLGDEFDKFFNSPKYKSDDFLFEAYEAESRAEALKLIKKALEIYPDNIDAQSFMAESETDPIKRLKKYDNVVTRAKEILEEDNYFEEDVGSFWGIIETRPYMRARQARTLCLIELGRYSQAMSECEDMLRLCENDNMGVRYILMGLYCVLEKFEEGEKLYKKYRDNTAHMLFPLAVLYFKKGEYVKAKRYIKKLDEVNPHIIPMLSELNNIIDDDENPYYSLGSEEEAVLVLKDFSYIIASAPAFLLLLD